MPSIIIFIIFIIISLFTQIHLSNKNEQFSESVNPFISVFAVEQGRTEGKGYSNAVHSFPECTGQPIAGFHIVVAMPNAGLIPATAVNKPLRSWETGAFHRDPVLSLRYLAMIRQRDVKISEVAELVEDGREYSNPEFMLFEQRLRDVEGGDLWGDDDGGLDAPIAQVFPSGDQHEILLEAGKKAE
jgi:hypothetical protein